MSGQTATIPKGTQIWGTFPEARKVARRTYTVTVHGIDRGYDGCCYCRTGAETTWTDTPEAPFPGPMQDGHGKHCIRPRHAQITWVGSGGYWHNARLDDVQISDSPTSSGLSDSAVANPSRRVDGAPAGTGAPSKNERNTQ